MREGWVECNLEDHIRLIDYRGRTPVKTASGVRLITAKNVKLGFLQLEPEEFIAAHEYEAWMRRGIPNFGDVIFTTEAPLANVAQIDSSEKLAFAQRIIVMQPDPSAIDQAFLKYMLLADPVRARILERATGATVQGIKSSLLRKIRIAFPAIPEQQHIVSILDEAFAAIDKAKANVQKNIANAKELFQSELNAIFSQRGEGWVEKRLGDVIDFLNGYAFKSGDSVNKSNTQLLRMGNLYQNRLNLDRSTVFYPDSFAKHYEKFTLKEGDLVISLTGTAGKEDFGFTLKIPKTKHSLLLNQRISKILIKDETELSKDFVHHYFISRLFLDVLFSIANGTRQANLSTETMKKMIIAYPPIKQQQTIVKKLEILYSKAETLTKLYNEKLLSTESLKKSILQKAFSGELVTEKAVVE